MGKGEQNINQAQDEILFVDTLENAIDSLETSVKMFDRTDPFKWKWIVLSLHHAFYSFCIINLKGSSPYEVVSSGYSEDDDRLILRGENEVLKSSKIYKENSQAYTIKWESVSLDEWNKAIDKAPKITKKENLIGFWTALARVQDSELFMRRYMHSKAVVISETELKSIEFLNYYRNKLTHFIPMSLGTHISTIKKCCSELIRPLRALAFETNQVLYFNIEEKERVRKALLELENKLS